MLDFGEYGMDINVGVIVPSNDPAYKNANLLQISYTVSKLNFPIELISDLKSLSHCVKI